jgi:hypothetical protein
MTASCLQKGDMVCSDSVTDCLRKEGNWELNNGEPAVERKEERRSCWEVCSASTGGIPCSNKS